MPFRSHDKNPLPQLVGLKTALRDGADENEGLHDLEVELGIFADEVEMDKLTIAVAVTKATLSMEMEGLEVVEKSKLGIDLAPQRLLTKSNTEATVQTSLEAVVAHEVVGSADIGTLAQSAKLSGTRSGKKTDSATATLKTSREVADEHVTVKAVGNDSWRISEPGDAVLDRTYLNYDRLCVLRRQGAKPNRKQVELCLYAKQKDLDVSITRDDRLLHISKSKEKIIGVLVSKALHETADALPYDGIVTLGVSKAEHED